MSVSYAEYLTDEIGKQECARGRGRQSNRWSSPCSKAGTTAWTRSRSPSLASSRADVGLDGVDADEQGACDLGVRQAAADRTSTSASRSVSRSSRVAPDATGAGELLDQASGEPGARAARRGDRADAADELVGRCVLQQEPARAGDQRVVHVSSRSNVVSMTTRGSSPGAAADAPGGLDAVHPRHPDVHQHHVRTQSRAASATASAPSTASPTTVEVVLGPQDHPQPVRTSSWSSARRTVVTAPAGGMTALTGNRRSRRDPSPTGRRPPPRCRPGPRAPRRCRHPVRPPTPVR